jgi:hypothetical protein
MSEESKAVETPNPGAMSATVKAVSSLKDSLPEKVEISEEIGTIIKDFYNAAVAAEQEYLRHKAKFQEFILYTKQKLNLPVDAPYGVTPDCRSFVLIKAPVAPEASTQSVDKVEQEVVQKEVPADAPAPAEAA